MTVVFGDTFTDVNGTLLKDHVADEKPPATVWVTQAGVDTDFEIQSNRARALGIGGAIPFSMATHETGVSDFAFRGRIFLGAETLTWIFFRALDGNNWIGVHINTASGNIQLTKNVAGLLTVLAPIVFVTLPAPFVDFEVICQGSSVEARLLVPFTNTPQSVTFSVTETDHQTETKVGLGNGDSNDPTFNDYENFLVETIPEVEDPPTSDPGPDPADPVCVTNVWQGPGEAPVFCEGVQSEDPDDIPDLFAWFVADDILGLSDDDVIGPWPDSQDACGAAASTPSNYHWRNAANGVGGHASVEARNDDKLPALPQSGGGGCPDIGLPAAGLTVVAVWQAPSAQSGSELVVGKSQYGSGIHNWRLTRSAFGVYTSRLTSPDPSEEAAGPNTLGPVIDIGVWEPGVRTQFFRNGRLIASAPAPAASSAITAGTPKIAMLGSGDNMQARLYGELPEQASYPRAFTLAEVAACTCALASKYGISI